MLVAVYGTLKSGYGNNRILLEGNATKIADELIVGYKLYNSGFPVATYSEDDAISCEIWDTHGVELTKSRLDMLEGEGRMYHREEVKTYFGGLDVQMYVGHDDFWRFSQMRECPHINAAPENDDYSRVYEWSR